MSGNARRARSKSTVLSLLCEASHNKDSSALLLLMMEKEMPIDCVLYADTGMDYGKTFVMQSK